VKQYIEYSVLRHERGTKVREQRVITLFEAFLSMASLIQFGAPLEQITLRTLEAYQSWRATDGAAKSTINTECRHLAAIWKWAVNRDLFTFNPFERLQALPVALREPEILSEDEIRRLFTELAGQPRSRVYGAAVLFVGNTGIRAGECFWAHVEDVDLGRQIFRLRSRPEYPIKRRRERIVPLNDIAYRIAQRQVEAEGRPGNFLFRTRTGGRISQTNALKGIKLAAERAGIASNVTWQALRRTFSTALVPHVSELGYMQIMGHSLRTGRAWYIDALKIQLPKPPLIAGPLAL